MRLLFLQPLKVWLFGMGCSGLNAAGSLVAGPAVFAVLELESCEGSWLLVSSNYRAAQLSQQQAKLKPAMGLKP